VTSRESPLPIGIGACGGGGDKAVRAVTTRCPVLGGLTAADAGPSPDAAHARVRAEIAARVRQGANGSGRALWRPAPPSKCLAANSSGFQGEVTPPWTT